MIVASLLLILVAVTLLVLGLTGGSSGLLISSIVASLLAAVFLVIGARQAAAARRAAERPTPGEPGYGTEGVAPDQAAYAEPEDAVFLAEPEFAAAEDTRRREAGLSDDLPPRAGGFAADSPYGSDPSFDDAAADQRDTVQFAPALTDDPRADAASGDLSADEARAAGRRDAGMPYAADASSGGRGAVADSSADRDAYDAEPVAYPAGYAGDDRSGPAFAATGATGRPDADHDRPRAGADADFDDADFDRSRAGADADFDRSRADFDDADFDRSRAGADADFDRARADDEDDYNRAFSAINAARTDKPGEEAWRRRPASGNPTDPEARRPADEDDDIWRDSVLADQAGAAADDSDAEFGAADEDDPADEPLPQAVRPTDAVRVARLDAEVLVVDGRPRYHLAECPHLAGRLTEPIPVHEAVELGFSPCGLCRPVDRLVGTEARR